jgi:hypothetical protein
MAFLVDASVPRRAKGTAKTKLKIVDDGSERLSWAFFPICPSLDASRTFAPPALLPEFTMLFSQLLYSTLLLPSSPAKGVL